MQRQQTTYIYKCQRCGALHGMTQKVDSVYCSCAWRHIEAVLINQIPPPARLSYCASAILREFRSSAEAHDEIAMMHAPSECHTSVAKSERRAIERILVEYGYTSAEQFVDELTARTSDKYVYFSGFAQLLDLIDLAPWKEHELQTVAPCDCDSSI